MPGPRPRTTDTPTCPAWKPHRRCTNGPIHGSARFAVPRGNGLAGITIQPLLYHVMVELLRPQHSPKTLPHNIFGIIGQIVRDDGRVEVVGFSLAGGEDV